jgi:fructan beta-fructosidase
MKLSTSLFFIWVGFCGTSLLASDPTKLDKVVMADGTHLLVPVANNLTGGGKETLLGIFEGERLVQNFSVRLPVGNGAFWFAAYPIEPFHLHGKEIKIATMGDSVSPEAMSDAFAKIKIGSASDAYVDSDYDLPYRNQFHPSTRRGWNNDPNGMVYHDGKYHLYYQYNPFGIAWGNMHWGHFESTDLIHWTEQPIVFYQRTVADMAFSGGGFVDVDNTSGLGGNTLFVAFTSTGRGECLAYSNDGGKTFTELDENPVVKHQGRDPKIFWYVPQKKWVMVVYDETACTETQAISPSSGQQALANRSMAFYESKDLKQWSRTGAFTDPDREAVYECPEMFQLPIVGKPEQARWILLGAQNRYFIGSFDGKAFIKESGPHGSRHGAFYAAQTFSDVPDDRRIQIGWVTTDTYLDSFPDEIVSQSFSLPHELTLRETKDGLRMFFSPVSETEKLRAELLFRGNDLTVPQANEKLQKCGNQLSEVIIEFSNEGSHGLTINGMDASFQGTRARIFTDRTFNEIYVDDGAWYEVRKRDGKNFEANESRLDSSGEGTIRSLEIYRLNSIWK